MIQEYQPSVTLELKSISDIFYTKVFLKFWKPWQLDHFQFCYFFLIVNFSRFLWKSWGVKSPALHLFFPITKYNKNNRLNNNYFLADFLAKDILKKSFRIENCLNGCIYWKSWKSTTDMKRKTSDLKNWRCKRELPHMTHLRYIFHISFPFTAHLFKQLLQHLNYRPSSVIYYVTFSRQCFYTLRLQNLTEECIHEW